MTTETQDPLPEDLVPRTAALLLRGGVAGLLAVLVLVGGLLVLTGAAALLAQTAEHGDWPRPFFSIVSLVLAFACVILVPLLAQAGPLAAFSLALTEKPRLGDALEVALESLPGLAKPTIVMLIPYGLLTFGVDSLPVRGSLEPGVVVVMGFASFCALVLAAWIQGRFALLTGTAYVLRSEVPVPATGRETLEVLGLGALPVSVLVAFLGRSLVTQTPLVPGSAGDFVVIAGAVVAFVATLFVSCALAVAIVSRP